MSEPTPDLERATDLAEMEPFDSADEPATSDDGVAEPTALRNLWASISAVVVKELRWRMRGRRAYVVVTAYVGLLGLLVFAVYGLVYDQATRQFGFDGEVIRNEAVSGTTSAVIGQSIFGVLLVLQTLLTLLLAPALTSGAVSMEREKQTLELLVTTPISTLGMVLGKLASSLAYVVLLVLASIPLMSLVFVFGGIAPDDVIRVYLMLFAVGFGVGSLGMFLSAWLKRTQLATAISLVIVVLLNFAAPLVHGIMYTSSTVFDNGRVERRLPPEALVWFSAISADIDLMCSAIPESYAVTCGYSTTVVGRELDAQNPPRDVLWPRQAAAFLILGVVLTLATTQFISKSRRVGRDRALPPPDGLFEPIA